MTLEDYKKVILEFIQCRFMANNPVRGCKNFIESDLETGINPIHHFSYIEKNGEIVGGKIEILGYVIAEYIEGGIDEKELQRKTFWNLHDNLKHICESFTEDFQAIIEALSSYKIGLNYKQHILFNKYFTQKNLIPNNVWRSEKYNKILALDESYKYMAKREGAANIDLLPDVIINEIFSFEFDIQGSNNTPLLENNEYKALGDTEQ